MFVQPRAVIFPASMAQWGSAIDNAYAIGVDSKGIADHSVDTTNT